MRRARKISFSDVPKGPKPGKIWPGLLDLRAVIPCCGLGFGGGRLWWGARGVLTKCHMMFLDVCEGNCTILIFHSLVETQHQIILAKRQFGD